MKLRTFTLAAILAALPSLLQADDHIELVEMMSELQRYTHKVHLSLQAGNTRLAGFYAHEMEEIIEALADIDEYDGHPVGRLVRERLEPLFVALENSLRGTGETAPPVALDQLLQACNGCHEATAHGYIVIRKNSHNPYMQSFKPAP